MARLREVQRFEQFFWDKRGEKTKVEDVQKAIAMVEGNSWLRKLVEVVY